MIIAWNPTAILCERSSWSSFRLPFDGARWWNNNHLLWVDASTGEASKKEAANICGKSSGTTMTTAKATPPETLWCAKTALRTTSFAADARGRRPSSFLTSQCPERVESCHKQTVRLRPSSATSLSAHSRLIRNRPGGIYNAARAGHQELRLVHYRSRKSITITEHMIVEIIEVG